MTTETRKLPALPQHDYERVMGRDLVPMWSENKVRSFAEQAVREALARDRAAMGEAVAWQIKFAGSYRGWENCTKECYDASIKTGRYLGLPGGTKDFQVRALYARPPVAGDAEQVDAVKALTGMGWSWVNGRWVMPDDAIPSVDTPPAGDAFGVCECGCGRKVCNRCGNEVDDLCPSRATPPAGDAQVREQMGQRISDYLCGLSENGMVTLDPFDSNSIDAIVSAALTPQPSGEVEG